MSQRPTATVIDKSLTFMRPKNEHNSWVKEFLKIFAQNLVIRGALYLNFWGRISFPIMTRVKHSSSSSIFSETLLKNFRLVLVIPPRLPRIRLPYCVLCDPRAEFISPVHGNYRKDTENNKSPSQGERGAVVVSANDDGYLFQVRPLETPVKSI